MTDHNSTMDVHTLVHRLFRALDARDFTPGWMDALLTADARMETPLGTTEGAEAERAAKEALGRYARTQHVASGILADMDAGAGRGSVSWNALMFHVHEDDSVFTVGGIYGGDLRRTSDGWRFSRISVRAVWTQGRPPVLPDAEARAVS
ncbi:nuclear transport factor 2 family protein [Streptomyces sp. HC307]|uniref:nuclear transport factor 2 family protein n=1 Tax=Streptomyces flavusporus TaxID=3385496 RepID=UPI003916D668